MAVQHGTASQTTEATQSNLSLTKPASTASGDFLFITMYAETGSGTAITVPTGFTKTTDLTHSSGNFRMIQCYRVADGSEGASFAFTHASIYCGGACERLRSDAALALALDVAGTASQGSSTSPASSVTTLVANTMLLWSQIDVDEVASTPPTGFTEGPTDTAGTTIAYKAQASAGASGTLTGTAGAGGAWICCTHSVKETGGASTKAPPPIQRGWRRIPRRRVA